MTAEEAQAVLSKHGWTHTYGHWRRVTFGLPTWEAYFGGGTIARLTPDEKEAVSALEEAGELSQ